jgi:hypothetical protein
MQGILLLHKISAFLTRLGLSRATTEMCGTRDGERWKEKRVNAGPEIVAFASRQPVTLFIVRYTMKPSRCRIGPVRSGCKRVWGKERLILRGLGQETKTSSILEEEAIGVLFDEKNQHIHKSGGGATAALFLISGCWPMTADQPTGPICGRTNNSWRRNESGTYVPPPPSPCWFDGWW